MFAYGLWSLPPPNATPYHPRHATPCRPRPNENDSHRHLVSHRHSAEALFQTKNNGRCKMDDLDHAAFEAFMLELENESLIEDGEEICEEND
jgi:hypothetical protein